jgi:hypothetical protein
MLPSGGESATMNAVSSSTRTGVLIAGDAVALLLFAVIGLLSHDRGIGIHGLVRDAVPVLGGWFVAAALLGTYRRRSWRVFLETWAGGITGGTIVRGIVLHRHVFGGRYLTFIVVTLVVSLLLLLTWRALAAILLRRSGRRGVGAASSSGKGN